jgi:hypothetical protein
MKLFKQKKEYELFTHATWGSYNELEEIVLSGSQKEIENYAKQAEFVWKEDKSRPTGGYFVKTIDGYRDKIYEIRSKKQ